MKQPINQRPLLKVGIPTELLSHRYFTGIEYYVFYLSEHLLQDGNYNIRLVTADNTLQNCISKPAKPGYFFSLLRLIKNRFFSLINNSRYSTKKIDIIHAPTVTTLFFKPRGIKSVMTVHDLIPNIFPEWHPLIRRLYFEYFLKYRFKSVDRFIAVSENTKNDLINLFNIDCNKIDVVYEGVSDKFKPANKDRKENFIFCVSTLEPRKNLVRLIEAYIRLKEKYNISEKLYITGKEGWGFENIYNIPERYREYIVFKGYVSHDVLIEMYQKAKLFVYPSLYEGFGLPVIEAMACGCPVVSSNSSSLPEVGGDAAIFVTPTDIVELSEKIYTVISNATLQKSMSQKGIRQAAKFTWGKCAENTIEVYKKAILS